MSNNYELLMSKLQEISDAVKMFPESLHEKVFDILVSELTGIAASRSFNSTLTKNGDNSKTINNTATHIDRPTKIHRGEALVEFFANNKNGIKAANNSEFAAIVAYFYQVIAPEDERQNGIDTNTFTQAFNAAKRRPIKKPNNTLNNAKKSGLLESNRRGYFSITALGRHRVMNEILAEADNNE